jgi:hypothetical protein
MLAAVALFTNNLRVDIQAAGCGFLAGSVIFASGLVSLAIMAGPKRPSRQGDDNPFRKEE